VGFVVLLLFPEHTTNSSTAESAEAAVHATAIPFAPANLFQKDRFFMITGLLFLV
jgi:hypothetical protein